MFQGKVGEVWYFKEDSGLTNLPQYATDSAYEKVILTRVDHKNKCIEFDFLDSHEPEILN